MKSFQAHCFNALLLALAMSITACQPNAQNENISHAKPYPLDTCLVCGMKLSQMSQPRVFVYAGQEIKVCDQSEKADFMKDPATYLKKLADAEAANKK